MQKNEEVKQFKTSIKVNKEMKKKAFEDKITVVAKDMKKIKEVFKILIRIKFIVYLEQQRTKNTITRGGLFEKFSIITKTQK